MLSEHLLSPHPRRLVLFGGPDRCGKTTIAHELSRRLDVPYFKPSGQTAAAVNDPGRFELQTVWGEPKLADFLQQTGYDAVVDRGFPCDWVYSNVLNRGLENRKIWEESIWQLDEQWGEMNALFVLCVRKSYAGIKDPRNTYLDEAIFTMLDDYYRRFLRRTKMRTLLLEVDDENLTRQIGAIMEALNG